MCKNHIGFFRILPAMRRIPILIIGAGPAGLAVAGRLRQLDMPFEILERASSLTPAWERHYDRVCLHTIKQYSALPHEPFPADYPQYVPKKDLLEYYQRYARNRKIEPIFEQEVSSVNREADGLWHVHTKQNLHIAADAVVVCTGFNREPYLPEIAGAADFIGGLSHVASYKNPKAFEERKVLVVGMGNSGAEIALDLCEHGVRVALSVRGPVNVIPRDFQGRPTQKTAMLINQLPVWLGDWLGRQFQKITVGDLSEYGLKKPPYAPSKQLRVFGKTPVIDVGTIDRIKAGEIPIFPGIESLQGKHVRFVDGQTEVFDHILLATGYRAMLEGFIPGIASELNERGHPESVVGSGYFKQLYFVGFDGYSSGLLNSIYKDSGNAVAHLYAYWKTYSDKQTYTAFSAD